MSKLVRIILLAAFAIFAVGFIWAIVVAIKKPNDVAKNNTSTTTTTTTQEQITAAPTPNVLATPAAPAAQTAAKPAPAKTRRQTITRRYVTYSSDTTAHANTGNAWANAGVDADGNAYAEAHVN